MEESFARFKVPTIDLIQVHSLGDVPTQLAILNMLDNIGGGIGRLPNEATRTRMAELVASWPLAGGQRLRSSVDRTCTGR